MTPSLLIESLGLALRALATAGGPYLVALVLILAAYGPGRSLSGRASRLAPLERWTLATGLGLVVLATVFFALGLVGWFSRGGVAAALALAQVPYLASRLRQGRRPGVPGLRLPSGPALALAVCGLLAALFVGTLALYPPLGFDATLYHLPAAKALAEGHRLPFLADSRVPVFPQLAEVLFGAALLFGDDRAARLLELATTALATLAVFGWVRRHASAAAGVWAAALWVGSPHVVLFGSDAYVDVTLALFGTLALQTLDVSREGPEGRWPWIAGALAGAAAATKYLGLYFVAAVPVGFLIVARRPPRLRAAGLALLVAAAVAAPWYGRIAYYTGNPVFPFFPEVFGASEWAPFVSLAAASESVDATAGGPAGALGSALRSVAVGSGGAWQTWRGAPPFDPFLWGLAPVALLLARRPRSPLLPILSGLAYGVVVWGVAPEPRYLLPALPWACAAVALGLHRLVARRGPSAQWLRRGAVATVALVLVAPGAAYTAYRIVRQGPVPETAAARETFLSIRRPGFAAVSWLDRRRGGDYVLYNLGGEDLRYFAQGRYRGDWSGPARFADVVAAAREGPHALARKLRTLEAGFLLVVDREAPGRWPVPIDLGGGFRLLYRDATSRLYAVPAPADVTATTPGAGPRPPRARPGARRPGGGRSAGGGG